jgi:hypothetical protein
MGSVVTSNFTIRVDWLPASHGSPEIRETSALLDIVIGDNVATRFDDAWSKSMQRSARVSAYPLALWIASSWWRLRWESLPFRTKPDTSWRMAHEMPGAGHGYLWPLLTFASDGDTIDATCRPSNPLSAEPVRYVADFRDTVEASAFERTLDEFVGLVIARLDAVGLSGTELRLLWNEVLEERADSSASIRRTLEARLGFEPDESPDALLSRLLNLSEQAGILAAEEIAPACAGSDPEHALDSIVVFAGSSGTAAHFVNPIAHLSSRSNGPVTPWQRGKNLAREMRKAYDLGSRPITDEELAGMLAIPTNAFQMRPAVEARPPLGLAIRNGRSGDLKLLFRKRNRPALRFEATRMMGDQMSTPVQERWLPVTDTGTARQKTQRAFAIEFLCPFVALDQYLQHDFSEEAVEDAGEYFGVSDLAVRSHLANHGQIPYDAVTV